MINEKDITYEHMMQFMNTSFEETVIWMLQNTFDDNSN